MEAKPARRCNRAVVSDGGARKLTVRLDPGEPISGSLQPDEQAPIAFAGWMELVALLESTRIRIADEPREEIDG